MNNRATIYGVVLTILIINLFALAWVASFVAGGPSLVIKQVEFDGLPGWSSADPGPALATFLRSCERLTTRPGDQPLDRLVSSERLQRLYGRVDDWRPVCAAADRLDGRQGADVKGFFEDAFAAFLVYERGRRPGLFTGYYEPLLSGSRTRQAGFEVPLRRLPADLVSVDLGAFRADLKGRRIAGRVTSNRLSPYETRADIVSGVLEDDVPVLVWIDDPIGVFFLHIQGSGRVVLTDGTVMRVGYAGQNGHPYSSIGRILRQRGELEPDNISMPSIKQWLEDNPDQAPDLLNQNASYVFFRDIVVDDPDLGPLGAQDVPLTARRSLAVDRRYVPLGAPVWLDGTKPSLSSPGADEPFQTLMVAQDTGGAIRGAQRGDVFWGFGQAAEDIAGVMQHPGHMYVLVPKDLADRPSE